jgi:hypothetical protein
MTAFFHILYKFINLYSSLSSGNVWAIDSVFYDFTTKSCRQKAEVTQNRHYPNVRNIGQGKDQHRKYKKRKLGGSQTYDCSRD